MAHLNYEPQVLVDTSDLTREVWLDWRCQGIGGSDAAAILGVSPFNTARDLYYDKLGIVSATDEEANWVQKEVGHLLEDLVAKIFAKKTGFKIYQIKKMFYHPDYPYMLADVDYFVELPEGKKAILEIKTTNYNATGNWWLDGKEVVLVNYEIQGRHYMAVMNIDRVYYCCLYGNTEDEVIIRHIDRDEMFEQELIFLEGDFWEKNVKAKNPPPYLENGELILESLKKHSGNGDADAPCVELDVITSSKLPSFVFFAIPPYYTAELRNIQGLFCKLFYGIFVNLTSDDFQINPDRTLHCCRVTKKSTLLCSRMDFISPVYPLYLPIYSKSVHQTLNIFTQIFIIAACKIIDINYSAFKP